MFTMTNMKEKWITRLAMSLALIMNFAYAVPPSLNLSSQLDPESIFSLNGGDVPTESIMTLILKGVGEQETIPIEAALAIDSSGSMKDSDPQGNRIEAAEKFIEITGSSNNKFGLVSWDNDIDFSEPLTGNISNMIYRLQDINSEGDTNLDIGLQASVDLFTNESSAKKVIIFLSDGIGPYTSSRIPGSQINRAVGENITIYTIGLNVKGIGAEVVLKDMAMATGGKYYEAPDNSVLENIYEEIANTLTDSAGTNVNVQYSVPSDLIISNYSLEPDNITMDSNTSVMRWYLGTISIGDTKNISFNVSSNNSGIFKLGSMLSTVDYIKIDGTSGHETFEEKILKIGMNTTLPQFKSGASVILGSIPVDFKALDQRAGMIYDLVESDESHIVWKFKGSTDDWAFVFNDGRIVLASTKEFDIGLRAELCTELGEVISMLNVVNAEINDEKRNAAIGSAVFYASEAGIYHKLNYHFDSDFSLTLFVPNSTIKYAQLWVGGLETGSSVYTSGQYYYIDDVEVLKCEMECGPGCVGDPTCSTGASAVTNNIPPGLHKFSGKARSPHTLALEILTSTNPEKKFVLYGPNFDPWINETSKSEDLQALRQMIQMPLDWVPDMVANPSS